MKIKILFLFTFLCIAGILPAQEKYQVSWDYRNQSFKEFVANAERLLKLKFFFREEWVSGMNLGNTGESNDLIDILNRLLAEKSLFYFIDEAGNVVITKSYSVKFENMGEVEKTTTFIPPTDYSSSSESRQTDGNTFIEVGNPSERNNPGSVAISGYITNKDTREPVPGVTVFVQKLSAGAISNAYGFYTLTLPRGIHLVKFSFIGMREKIINLNLNGPGEMNVEMNSVLIPLKETVVSAQRSITLQRFEVGAEKINIASFKLMPTALGEADIIKSILLLPGVQSVGEGSSGFNVRGGTADQNLILLNGAPLYNTSHLFGFFSAVNSDIIKDVTLFKGGIPGKYGGRISSVLDISTKDGNRKEFAGTAGISPITTHLMVEGPIIKDTLTYLLAGRTSYSNWIFRLIDDPALVKSRATFYDLNAKVTYDLDKNNRIDLSGYYSHDSFRFNSDTVYGYDNNNVVLRWRHFFTSRFLSVISVNNSFYKYDISSHSVGAEAFVMSHNINSTALKADFNWFKGRNEINFGTDLIRHDVMPGSYLPAGDSSLVIPDIIDDELAWEGGFYIDDKLTVTNYLSVNVGLRFSYYFNTGPGNVLVYNPEFSKSRSTVIDTLNYSNGGVTARYGGFEPRISLNFKLSDKSSLKINYNRTRQYLHLLSNSTSISPSDTWKLSDYHIKPQVGDQIALGFYRMFRRNSIETSAEVYYKAIGNMVDFKGGTRIAMDKNVEKDIANVKGKAYGIELVMKKTEGKIRYGIGYTYSRTFVRSTGTFSDEIINSGKWFPANFDKPNDLVLTFSYLFSRRISFSSDYTYSTGRPITYPVAVYDFSNKLLVHYSDRNKYRLPDYSRLDISLKVSGNLKSRRIAHPSWTFSVYNLLGRENAYSVYFKQEGQALKGYKLSVFGQAIPSVTFSFDF
jgi:hypothetical protein